MHVFRTLFLTGMLCSECNAQIFFSATNLPGQIGQYSQAYITNNLDVSALFGASGGPQRWDFSQPQQPGESIRRMDVVAPSDGGHGSSFPNAAYAERYTDEPAGAQEWDYYSIPPSLGQSYFGFYNAAAGGVVVISPPAVDIPWSVDFGTNWNYSLDEGSGPVSLHLTASASVDAYGTLVLPQIGEVPALRVNQLNTQQDFFFGFPDGDPTYFREYYWLVPGIGIALHIISNSSNSPPILSFAPANEVRRVFESSSVTNQAALTPVGNLHIRLQNGVAILNWTQATNASAYEVEALGALSATNWQSVSLPASNSWSEALTTTQRFYRVSIKP